MCRNWDRPASRFDPIVAEVGRRRVDTTCMHRFTSARRLSSVAVLILAIAGCAQNERPVDNEAGPAAIRVASFDFSESEVLAEIYATALERRQFEVTRVHRLASREIILPALEQGRIDLVPEYLGSALEFVTLGRSSPRTSTEEVHRQLSRAMEQQGMEVLDPAPAQNKNVVVVAKRLPEWHLLHSLSELASVSKDMAFGGPPECPNRPLCLRGLEAVYGLQFREFVPLDASGPLTAAALESGEVDAALMFSTDPALNDDDLNVLRDDKKLQPPENVVPVIRREVMEKYGAALVDALNSVSKELRTSDLRDFNRLMRDGSRAQDVAVDWLDRHGL